MLKSKLNNEKLLVKRLIQDDETAFCELYSLYKNRLMYFILQFVKSKDAAEDIYQDVFTAIWQNRHLINSTLSFSAYLYTITRNKILDVLSNISSEVPLHDYIMSQAIDYDADIHNQITGNELADIISKTVSKLTNRQQEVFELSRNQGLSHNQIAKELQISINTVQEHISAALKAVRISLNKYYPKCLVLIFFVLSKLRDVF